MARRGIGTSPRGSGPEGGGPPRTSLLVLDRPNHSTKRSPLDILFLPHVLGPVRDLQAQPLAEIPRRVDFPALDALTASQPRCAHAECVLRDPHDRLGRQPGVRTHLRRRGNLAFERDTNFSNATNDLTNKSREERTVP